MAPVMNDPNLMSDEDYLISKAKLCQKTDPCEAKAWIITAKTLFPQNFGVQYEAYKMAKEDGNIPEAAGYLADMFHVFHKEDTLWMEVQMIVRALRSENRDADSVFYRDMFSRLLPSSQYEMLLLVADHCEDTIELCKLMLLLLKRFPEKITEHGIKLIDTLSTAEKHGHYQTPVNHFRKLLICDVMPLILQSSSVQIPARQMYRLLLKAVEFYVCYATGQSCKDPDSKSGCDQISGRFELDEPISTPWEDLFTLVESVGRKQEWELAEIFSSTGRGVTINPETQVQRILSFVRKNTDSNMPLNLEYSNASSASTSAANAEDIQSARNKQIFYCTAVIFLHCLYMYEHYMNSQWFPGSNPNDPQFVLIEQFDSKIPPSGSADQPKHKKKKLDAESRDVDDLLTVSKTISPGVMNALKQNFQAALKCWELLQSNGTLQKELTRLSQQIRMQQWLWFKSFYIDALLYQGCHEKAIEELRLQMRTSETMKNKLLLQLASCYYSLGKQRDACNHLLDMMISYSSTSNRSLKPTPPEHDFPIQPKISGRHMHIICFEGTELLQYCVSILLTCYKEKALVYSRPDDVILGHLIVLTQYNWPREEGVFLQAVNIIKRQGSFCYGLFFNYIIAADILEEFMHLSNNGNVNLDLLPSSIVQVGRQRAVTRGVNKGAKEDFKLAMERQMARCEENLDQLLIKFFKQERAVLLQHL